MLVLAVALMLGVVIGLLVSVWLNRPVAPLPPARLKPPVILGQGSYRRGWPR